MGSLHGTMVAEEHGARRSPHWPSVEKHFLASNPRCIACDDAQHQARSKQAGALTTRGLQVHHAIMPYHFCILLERPDLELDPRNLATFCENESGILTQDHHIVVGHLLNFQSYMPDAKSAAVMFRGMSREQITADMRFVKMVAQRPKTWAHLNDVEKHAMRKMLDTFLPRCS